MRLFAALACLLALSACDSTRPDAGTPRPAPEPSALTVTTTNAAADGAFDGGTLAVRLSAPLDTASLGARAIRTAYAPFPSPEEEGPLLPLDIWEVIDAEAVRVNGAPTRFWYSPAQATLLFVTGTSAENPDGLFSPFTEAVNEVVLTADLRGVNGETLPRPITLAATPSIRASDPRPIPMPVYGSTTYARELGERLVRFVNLRPGVIITIEEPDGVATTILHLGGGTTADWSLPADGSGVYSYRVEQGDEVLASGLLPVVTRAATWPGADG